MEKLSKKEKKLWNVISINKILNRKENDKVGLIGIIVSKNITKKGNIILELEDPTGSIKVIITKNKKNIFDLGNNLVLDEVVGIVGNSGDKVVFCNNIIFPELPINKELKKIRAKENKDIGGQTNGWNYPSTTK